MSELIPPVDVPSHVLDGEVHLGAVLRRRRVQLGWSQVRLARDSGVSRTVVNEVENGRRSPSLATYERLRVALGLDLPVSLALLPVSPPVEVGEVFLATLSAALVTGRQVALADLATALNVGVAAVRAGVRELTGRLAAVGLAAVDDGVAVAITVLGFAADPVGRVAQLDTVRTLTPEAVMTLVILGDLGEATRRQIDERRGVDSTGLLDRLVGRQLLERRSDRSATGQPNAYRLTTRALTLLGHATVESFQTWCREQVSQAGSLQAPNDAAP